MNKKTILIGTALFVAVSIVGLANALDHPKKPTVVHKNQVTKVATTKEQAMESQDGTPVPVTVTPDPTPAPTPVDTTTPPTNNPTYFSASSDQYPGNGAIDLPAFSTSGEWSVTFSYTCDSGKVFFTLFTGSTPLLLNNSPAGPFAATNAHLRVTVPAGQTCSWQVSVS